MKKYIFLFFILFLPLVQAYQTIPIQNGMGLGVANYPAAIREEGDNHTVKISLFRDVIEEDEPKFGGVFSNGIWQYYDVIVDVVKSWYFQFYTVTADVTFENKGHLPTRDSRVTYYLQHLKSDTRYGETVYTIEEMPPGETILHYNIQLPFFSRLGEWQFVVEYETDIQKPIRSFDSFNVWLGWWYFVILILIIIYYRRKKKEDVRKKEEEEEIEDESGNDIINNANTGINR